MPPRRPPPSSASSIGALLNRAQDTSSAAAHAKLAPHLWAHLGKLGEDAFWGELVGAVDYLLTIAPVRFLCGDGAGAEEGAEIGRERRRAPARMRQRKFRFPRCTLSLLGPRHSDRAGVVLLRRVQTSPGVVELGKVRPQATEVEKGARRPAAVVVSLSP